MVLFYLASPINMLITFGNPALQDAGFTIHKEVYFDGNDTVQCAVVEIYHVEDSRAKAASRGAEQDSISLKGFEEKGLTEQGRSDP